MKKSSPKKAASAAANKPVTHTAKLPSAVALFKQSLGLLAKRPKLFGGIILIHGLLLGVLVKGLSSNSNLLDLKGAINEILGSQINQVGTGLALFGNLVATSATPTSEGASLTQSLLIILSSLALIWGLRRVSLGESVSVKQAYYQGMYPLIPFVLVVVVMGLQTIPLSIGNAIFTAVNQLLGVSSLERALAGGVFALLALGSFYLLSSSVFALYIVSLPGVAPIAALRSAKQLVKGRRLKVISRLIGLIVILLIIAVAIMLPILIWATVIGEWAFFALTTAAIAVVHAYLYSTYKSLLK